VGRIEEASGGIPHIKLATETGVKFPADEEWKTRKPPIYCRPHGRRILVFINNIGGCRRCVDNLTKIIEQRKEKKNVG